VLLTVQDTRAKAADTETGNLINLALMGLLFVVLIAIAYPVAHEIYEAFASLPLTRKAAS
jgi:hypothetical protein